MSVTTEELRDLVAAARRTKALLGQLELMPHGTVARFERVDDDSAAPVATEPPVLPPGGVLRRDDREQDYLQKSHQAYRRRFERCRSVSDFDALAKSVRETIEFWQHGPPRPNPERGSLDWKRMIANSNERVADLVRVHGISRAAVYRYRSLYRTPSDCDLIDRKKAAGSR